MFKLKEWDWSDGFLALLYVALLAVAVMAICFISAPHVVDGYYLSGPGDSGGKGYCAAAHWTNKPDSVAYCSDDIAKVQLVVEQANRVSVPGQSVFKFTAGPR